MLHELFLVLAGHTSPLFTPELPENFPLISPSERALLNDLAGLGILHRRIRHSCDLITTHHPSTIARAVACGIVNNLQKFRAQVTDTEKLILRQDDLVVGAYNIVPLAKIVSLFSGWRRVLEYMEGITRLMLFGTSSLAEEEDEEEEEDVDEIEDDEASDVLTQKGVKGAKIIDRLREDMHTGYPSIESLAIELLNTAELAWLRQVSTWVLYGRLPTFGSSDFMIREMATTTEQEDAEGELEETALSMDFALSKSNVPKFVTPQTASSILFVGRALHQIRRKGGLTRAGSNPAAVTSEKALLQEHLGILQDLKTPLSPALFQAAVSSIRDSLSTNTLQALLPPEQISDVLHILREFYLLGRGEFAVGLVEQAEDSIKRRLSRPALFKSKTGTTLGSITVKDGEVGNVLKRTWGALSLRQSEEEHDDRLDRARDVLYMTLHSKDGNAVGYTPGTGPIKVPLIVKNLDKTAFNDLLLGVPISLGFNLTWPLELFLTPQDLEVYHYLFHYLLSIRRAQMKLQSLWQARRNTAVQGLATRSNKMELKKKRETLVRREHTQRMAWATANLCIFVLESLGIYIQSNVIDASFADLESVVGAKQPASNALDTPFSSSDNPIVSRAFGSPGPANRRSMPPGGYGSVTGRPKTPQSPRTPTVTSPASHRRRFTLQESPEFTRDTSRRPETPATPKNVGMEVEDEEKKKVANPETLTLAHQRYLRYICQQSFITDNIFTNRLRNLLELCEALMAQITTLMRANEVLDLLDVDDTRDMSNELVELSRLCTEIRGVLGGLVRRLHEMDEERDRVEAPRKRGDFGGQRQEQERKEKEGLRALGGGLLEGAGIDKLLMKLDFAALNLGAEA